MSFTEAKNVCHGKEKLKSAEEIQLADESIIKALLHIKASFNQSNTIAARSINIELAAISSDYIKLSKQKNLYIHRELYNLLPKHIDGSVNISLSSQVLFYAGTQNDTAITKYVYCKDKYAEIRNISESSVDRFDTFRSTKNNHSGVYRHNGTFSGAVAKKCARREIVKDGNIPVLYMMQYGPAYAVIDMPLCCSSKGALMEYRGKTMAADIHHVVCIDKSSYYAVLEKNDRGVRGLSGKTNEPSALLASCNYKDFSEQQWSELLGCILLSNNSHRLVHKDANSDIAWWFSKPTDMGTESLPYAWHSEFNYNEVLSWIKHECNNIDLSKFLTYDEFIAIHTV